MIDPKLFLQAVQSLTTLERFVVALSGGRDSVVLLHLLVSLPPQYRTRAVYIDHGLSQESANWGKFCARLCQQYAVPFEAVSIAEALGGSETNIESRARGLRYQALFGLLGSNEALVTAHHADDQAETVLLQMLRGAGLMGLSAMPNSRVEKSGTQLIRPLLKWTRANIDEYAKLNGLRWCDDASNHDHRYARNFLRRQVMPVLCQRWPSFTQTIGRSAAHCAEASELLRELADGDIQACVSVCGFGLSVTRLMELSDARQRNAWRYWLQKHQVATMPSRARLQSMIDQLLLAAQDRCPSVDWESVSLSRYRDTIYCTPKMSRIPELKSWSWQPQQVISKLEYDQPWSIERCDLLPGFDAQAPVIVGPRKPGVKLNYGPGRPHGTLKNWLQEKGVPPWMRDRTPILYQNGWVVGAALYQLCFTAQPLHSIEQ